eukprot:1752593-Amphidinium_carterae.1
MATPEQVQELVARIQAMEAREADGLAREQVLQSTVQNLTTQLATTQQQATNTAPVVSTFSAGTVDTRALGKPEVFERNETKWHDFRVVFKAYCACLNQRLGVLMSSVEANSTGSFSNNGLDQRDASQLQALLSWKFARDIEGRIEAFEREILCYEHASGESVSDSLRIGIVLRQMEETKLKEYLLMNIQTDRLERLQGRSQHDQ